MTNTTIGILFSLAAVAALGWMIWIFVTAPYGWEDRDGWHEGEPPEHSDFDGDK